MVTGRGDGGCIFCGSARIKELEKGKFWCEECKKLTTKAEIFEKGVRY